MGYRVHDDLLSCSGWGHSIIITNTTASTNTETADDEPPFHVTPEAVADGEPGGLEQNFMRQTLRSNLSGFAVSHGTAVIIRVVPVE